MHVVCFHRPPIYATVRHQVQKYIESDFEVQAGVTYCRQSDTYVLGEACATRLCSVKVRVRVVRNYFVTLRLRMWSACGYVLCCVFDSGCVLCESVLCAGVGVCVWHAYGG